ncbi:MAG TPA: hypothetical protein VKE74_24575 [Gemmataceae bacterium]|nr:hypothetical protein [Gemmataceae bacterium]
MDKARLLLAEVRDATDAKKVADLAHAAEVYARRQKLGEECVAYAREVVVDAMTLMGEMLKQTPKATAGRPPEIGSCREPISKPPTLADHGISKKESSEAQVLATVKETNPELHAHRLDDRGGIDEPLCLHERGQLSWEPPALRPRR